MHVVQTKAGASLISTNQTRAGAARARRRRGLFWVVLLLAAVWVVADQATKWWAESALSRGESRDFIPGFLEFRLVYNPGAAFSFATNATALLTVFAVGVVIFLVVMARRLESLPWTIALGLLLGGALGNLIDRLFRDPGPGRGHVVDFLRFENFPFIDFPIFNVADIGVTTAAILIILLALFGIAPDGGRLDRQARGLEATEPPATASDSSPSTGDSDVSPSTTDSDTGARDSDASDSSPSGSDSEARTGDIDTDTHDTDARDTDTHDTVPTTDEADRH